MATQLTAQGQVANKTKENVEVSAVDREVGAAFIASGIGAFALGLVIVLTEMKSGTALKNAMNWNAGVGPLSGKTGVAVIAFVLSWVILHFTFQRRPVKMVVSFTVALVLIILGLLLSFPPVFVLFAG